MADETRIELTNPATNAMDYGEHERSYALFLGIAKWLVIGVGALLVFMWFTLA